MTVTITRKPGAADHRARLALQKERAGMQPFRRAFMAALTLFPAPGFPHMLAAYDAAVTAARATDPYAPLVIWHDHVVQMVRTHPDMDAFAAAFGIGPEVLDMIFRVAMAIERGASPAEIAAMVEARQ